MSLNLSTFEILSLLAIPAVFAAFSLFMIKRMKQKTIQKEYTVAQS